MIDLSLGLYSGQYTGIVPKNVFGGTTFPNIIFNSTLGSSIYNTFSLYSNAKMYGKRFFTLDYPSNAIAHPSIITLSLSTEGVSRKPSL